MNLPSALELNQIDMRPVVDHFIKADETKYLTMPAGKEHYRLLRWFAETNSNKRITEIGCHMALSTVCLAWNKQNMVTTYDIDYSYLKWKQQPNNVYRLQTFGANSFYPGVYYSDIIFVDTAHYGIMEIELFKYLKSMEWKGLLIYDDIYLNDEMMAFWKAVDVPKIDATNIGHSTGTGIIEL